MRHSLYGMAFLSFVTAPLAGQERTLTTAAARLNHQFSTISGLRELPDGRVLVSDRIDDVLLRADLVRQKIDTIGRAGQGPGEYRWPDGLFALPGGATLLVDLGNARLAVFDLAGRFKESFPIVQGNPGAGAGPVPLIFPRGTDNQGRIYYQPIAPGPRADSGQVVRWDRAASRFDTLARVRLPVLVVTSSGSQNNRRESQRQRPYPVQDSWTVAPDGRLAVLRAPSYRVDWVAANSPIRIGNPIVVTPVSIRDAEKKEYLAEAASNGLSVAMENVNGQVSMRFSRGRQGRDDDRDEPDLSGQEWPATKPATTGLALVAPDGRLWVERSVAANAPRVYDVIGTAGEVLFRVSLPVGRRLVVVGTRGLYVRHVDADGINHLERYDLQ